MPPASLASNRRRHIGIILAGLLFLLAGWTLLWGVADLYAAQAKAWLERWSASQEPPPKQELEKALRAIAIAENINPRSPDIQERYGRILEWKTEGRPPWREDVQQDLQAALTRFQKANALRPAWPYSWVAVARIKLKLLELDDLFLHALQRALDLGPWEPEVQLAAVEIGLLSWDVLDDALRKGIEESFSRSLKSQPREVIALAVNLGKTEFIRRFTTGHGQYDKYLAAELRRFERMKESRIKP